MDGIEWMNLRNLLDVECGTALRLEMNPKWARAMGYPPPNPCRARFPITLEALALSSNVKVTLCGTDPFHNK